MVIIWVTGLITPPIAIFAFGVALFPSNRRRFWLWTGAVCSLVFAFDAYIMVGWMKDGL